MVNNDPNYIIDRATKHALHFDPLMIQAKLEKQTAVMNLSHTQSNVSYAEMRNLISAYLHKIGTQPIYLSSYLNFASELHKSLNKKLTHNSGIVRTRNAVQLQQKWISRGLDPDILCHIATFFNLKICDIDMIEGNFTIWTKILDQEIIGLDGSHTILGLTVDTSGIISVTTNNGIFTYATILNKNGINILAPLINNVVDDNAVIGTTPFSSILKSYLPIIDVTLFPNSIYKIFKNGLHLFDITLNAAEFVTTNLVVMSADGQYIVIAGNDSVGNKFWINVYQGS
jgi:hypothetical protein